MLTMRRFLFIFLILFFSQTFSTATAMDIALPEMGDSAGAIISPRDEFQIGQAFFWRLQQSTELVSDPEVENYIQTLGYRLVSNSDDPARDFTFFVVPDPAINAFAAPGGFIGVNSGLLLAADTEDEVASVMAHEIAHVTQRHILRSIERNRRMTIPRTAAMIAAALLGVADPSVGSAAIMAVQAGDIQSQLDYSRAHESEADNIGMETLVASGFNPGAMPTFFEKLQQASRYFGGDAVPEFLRTHPVTSSRIADARGRAAQLKVQKHLGDELSFYLIKEKLRVLMAQNMGELLRHYDYALNQDDVSHKQAVQYGHALALLKKGDLTKARSIIQTLIDSDHERLAYQLAMADIEMAVGRVDAALAIYDENQRLYPDDQALSMKQVNALLRIGRPQQAANLLQAQLNLGNNSRDVYKLMAQAKGALGQKSQSHVWLAEFYYRSGLLRAAVDQLQLAAESAGRDEYQRARIASRLREVENAIAQMEQ